MIDQDVGRKWWHAISPPAEPQKSEIVPGLSRGRGSARDSADTTPGRCGNLDYCSIGMQRILVEVPVGRPFTCPECGSRLRPPVVSGLQRPWVLPAIRIAILLAGVGLGTILGYMMGHLQPAVGKAVGSVSQETVDKVNAARALLGLPKVTADAIKMAPPMPPPQKTSPAAAEAPSPSRLVVEHAYPRNAPPLETEDPPAHLADEQHFGQVVIDCTLGALQVKPECRTSNIRGADAFSAAAVAWLEGLSIQYGPGIRHGVPTLLDHRWRVYFEDFSGTAAPAKPGTLR